jgi:hypothetical protein
MAEEAVKYILFLKLCTFFFISIQEREELSWFLNFFILKIFFFKHKQCIFEFKF